MGTFLDFPKLAAVLDDAYADLFGIAPHVENESSTRNLLARRIVDIAQTGETDPELLKQYAMSGFALRNTSTICAVEIAACQLGRGPPARFAGLIKAATGTPRDYHVRPHPDGWAVTRDGASGTGSVQECGIPHFTRHDVRRSFANGWQRIGVALRLPKPPLRIAQEHLLGWPGYTNGMTIFGKSKTHLPPGKIVFLR